MAPKIVLSKPTPLFSIDLGAARLRIVAGPPAAYDGTVDLNSPTVISYTLHVDGAEIPVDLATAKFMLHAHAASES